ncbi:MAG: N-acetyl-gamma-glutamyl-phosphate reductase [Melioribacteraceae bacterium]|nr:N-acetyl-gamma-glutamyl-phosphate reductase [Melioribacteraceae bacterium]
MISVGIIGGTGYTGKYLIEYCTKHPYIKDFNIYAKTSAGENLHSVFPQLVGTVEDQTINSVENISLNHDAYFIALPHGESLNYIPSLESTNKLVIDLGGDYRLDEESLYEKWYNYTHSSSYLLSKKVYGLADESIDYTNTNLISNPGCYPTGSLLALLPLVKNFSENILSISISAYSGTSGAGKSPKADLMLSEMDGNVKAYNVNKHRHLPEIAQELAKAGYNRNLSFTTHLLPISKGIYTTCSIHLKNELDENSILETYKNDYTNSNYIRLRTTPPDLSWVVNTNYCDINICLSGKTLIITSAIDNLIKGASGQAMQNMNQYFGWENTLGIMDSKLNVIDKKLISA